MKQYPDLKESRVPWMNHVPSHWTEKRIKFAAEINPSKSEVRGLAEDTEVTFLPMEAVGEMGELDVSRTKPLGEVINGYTYLGEGDVLLAKITPCFENGKGAVATGLHNGVGFATTEVIPLRCFNGSDNRFLYYLLYADPFRAIAEGSMYGAGGQKRVADTFVANYASEFPSVSEQTAIANFLERETAKIDTLIEKQEQLIKLLEEKRQAVISHAVTKGLNPDVPMKDSGVEWLGEVPEHWNYMSTKYFCSHIKDGTHLPPPRVDVGIPLLSVRNIINGQFVLRDDDSNISEESYSVLCRGFVPKQGDVLLAVVGATLGKTAIIRIASKFQIQRSVAVFRCNSRMSNEYLNLIYRTVGYQQLLWQNVGFSAQPGVYLGALADFRLPVPPMDEQLSISSFCKNKIGGLDSLIQKAGEAISLAKERRTALISAAVTGKIDVREAI